MRAIAGLVHGSAVATEEDDVTNQPFHDLETPDPVIDESAPAKSGSPA